MPGMRLPAPHGHWERDGVAGIPWSPRSPPAASSSPRARGAWGCTAVAGASSASWSTWHCCALMAPSSWWSSIGQWGLGRGARGANLLSPSRLPPKVSLGCALWDLGPRCRFHRGRGSGQLHPDLPVAAAVTGLSPGLGAGAGGEGVLPSPFPAFSSGGGTPGTWGGPGVLPPLCQGCHGPTASPSRCGSVPRDTMPCTRPRFHTWLPPNLRVCLARQVKP